MDDADITQARQEAEDALRARYKQPPAPCHALLALPRLRRRS